MAKDPASEVMFTNQARCRDCYRCVRACPVKAIRMHEGQAYVVEERCVLCGTCIRECPQGAKSFRNDVEHARRLIASGLPVAVSVAPSLAAVFTEWERRRLPSALRQLGFRYVGETAIGAYHVAKATAEYVKAHPNQTHVCTACPAVVRYVERYRPEWVDRLVPVVSPMIAHARHILDRLGNETKIVFIGPCVAKKAEADRSELKGLVDCVLTFPELQEWFGREGIDLSACEESDFDEAPAGAARLFPLEGGCVRTAGWSTDILDGDVVAVSGFDEVRAVLDDPQAGPRVIEPLFCPHGCVNGPAITGTRSDFARRGDVLRYAADNESADEAAVVPEPGLETAFRRVPVGGKTRITEEAIRGVLEMTGKAREEDQLNCGACGYPTCREKAVAVLQGLAEPQMCIPYMRRLAEQRTDRIIETSPNGIVILDDELRILHMNPAFRKFFVCSDAVCGQPVSYLMDPGPFERLASGQESVVELTAQHDRYHLVCHEILYALREEKQFVGIFVNITKSLASQEKLDKLRAETVLQARELLQHQLDMAEQLARYLGESTARGETLVEKLMVLADGAGESGKRQDASWRDSYK